ncbi:MAG: hypothetical protein JO139_02255 [Alphaproteobacteria bacterium]|nr:hypothetical protein [Alphaproteobacteria bacterium]
MSCTPIAPEIPPDVLLQRVKAGDPIPECNYTCRDAWNLSRPTALILNETRHWPELAVLVMQIGYVNDLTYYYLGRAAEGLGYRDAAKTYYQISQRLTVSGRACSAEGSNFCNGEVFPAAAQAQLLELTQPSPSASPKQVKPAPSQPSQNTAATATVPDFAAPPPIRH